MSKVYVWQENHGRERYQHPMWMGVGPESDGAKVMDLAWEQRLGDPVNDTYVITAWLESHPPGFWMLDPSSRKDVEELFHDALQKMRAGT